MQKIIFALFLSSLPFYASEYIFSYQLGVKNGIILKEKYYFSPTMIGAKILKKDKNPYKKCEIPHLARSEKEFLKDYKEEILECFFTWGIKLEDRTETKYLQSQSTTFLWIPPMRIQIEFENGIATIYALKNKEMR
ncbi:hypothetical protein [Helicobacter mesocricetorum]|uniref:hypothetical protein n=1 Tax=Helicobacter mesocricetorum TaxID=87012 RepID=UPI000CF05FDD|nr:hypothetical protein [Helicobacter mesocricetorum]